MFTIFHDCLKCAHMISFSCCNQNPQLTHLITTFLQISDRGWFQLCFEINIHVSLKIQCYLVVWRHDALFVTQPQQCLQVRVCGLEQKKTSCLGIVEIIIKKNLLLLHLAHCNWFNWYVLLSVKSTSRALHCTICHIGCQGIKLVMEEKRKRRGKKEKER